MQPHTNKFDHLTKLIARKLSGDMSQDEESHFMKWLNESKENKRLFERLESEDYFDERLNIVAQFNVEEDWNKVRRVIQSEVDNSRRIRHVWMKVAQLAAAVLIPVGIFIMLYTHVVDSDDADTPTLSHQIKPGESKATLTLQSGEIYHIDKNDTVINVAETQVGISVDSVGVLYQINKKVELVELRYNTLETPRGGEFQLSLADGTRVWLNASTKLRYPERFGSNSREVYVEGEAYFEVATDKVRPFFVHFNNSRTEVLGTEFNIKAYADNPNSIVTLSEGRIRVTHEKEAIEMTPDHQLIINRKSNKFSHNEVDASLYSAWKDGKLVYQGVELEEILEDIARWYNVNVFYQNQGAKDVEFSLYLNRYEDFSRVLDVLQATGKVEFEEFENNIIVRTNY